MGTLYFAGQGMPQQWAMKREMLSPRYTTRYEDLLRPDVQDILIACVDGLKGFPGAINSVFPQTHIQLCIIHMVRNSLKYVSGKTTKPPPAASGPAEDAVLMAMDAFAKVRDDKYPQISKSWRAHRENLNTLFSYPPDIRKAIYTTNAIESLNCVIRAAIKKRKVFPTDDSVRKVIYLAIKYASKNGVGRSRTGGWR